MCGTWLNDVKCFLRRESLLEKYELWTAHKARRTTSDRFECCCVYFALNAISEHSYNTYCKVFSDMISLFFPANFVWIFVQYG